MILFLPFSTDIFGPNSSQITCRLRCSAAGKFYNTNIKRFGFAAYPD